MKRKLLLLFALLFLLLDMSSCRMRDVQGTSYKVYNQPRKNSRHYGAKKSIWQRKALWGNKRYGPRPHAHRGRYRQ
ncbi:MAG: hypothetical protein K9G49_00860 [Taibaiella sp.]|nr:hypothetical protein [Taibaiella sp.]